MIMCPHLMIGHMIERAHLIEPSTFIQQQVESIFRKKGIKTFVSGTGAEAINLLAKTFPEVIILEVDLPDCKGTTLLRSLKKALPNMRFVILASTLDKETLVEIIQMGIKDVFIKPFCVEKLLEKIAA